MSNNLYAEAIAEAKQLREMAEQNAKNKIIEAVTPRIKALIEAQIMGEQDEPSDDDVTGVDIAMMTDEMEPEEDSLDLPTDELMVPDELKSETEKENTSVVVNASGDVNISVAEGRGNRRGLSKNTRSTTLSGKVNLAENINSVRRRAKRMDAMLQGLQFNKLNETQRTLIKKAYQELLSEALLMKRLLLREGAEDQLTTSYKQMIKEIKNMTRRSSTIFRRLFEIDEMADEMEKDEMDMADEAMKEEDEEGGEGGGDVDVDAASSALEDLGSALGLDVEIEEEGGDDEGDDDDEEEIDLGEYDEMDMADEEDEMREADSDEEDEMREGDEEDEEDEMKESQVYEIDEGILRREIKRLRRLREAEGVDSAALDDFGGGDDEGDMFVDVDEDDLLNALSDELGTVPSIARESRNRRATRRTAAQNRKLQNENRKLKKQLSEMNLFNAKLLYVNKLMQNRNVTQKQQRAIVEALDNAKTIREAKFLYQGLAKSLVKRTTRTMNESANSRKLLSSASKSTRSGSAALNEDTVAARWATLAGIRK